MRAILLIFGLALLLVPMAQAGPWPREKGATFLAFSLEGEEASVWAERGLGRNRWAVFEGSYRSDHSFDLMLSLYSALPDWHGFKLSWHMGLKVSSPMLNFTLDMTPVPWPSRKIYYIRYMPIYSLRAGLSAGRAVEWPWQGWIAADAYIEHNDTDHVLHTDLTWGVKPDPRWMGILQVQLYKPFSGPLSTTLAPSAVIPLREGVQLQLGLRHRIGQSGVQARLGSWLEF